MKLFRSLFLAVGVFQVANANDDFITGMRGLQQAAKDPKLLAQLMQDLNDPEMMAEAKKMMENPEWKKEMKKMEKSKEFKKALEETNEMLKDPNMVAKLEAKMEASLAVGEKQLQKDYERTLMQALETFENDENLSEMKKYLNDPEFRAKIQEDMKDPQVRQYFEQARALMEDPSVKERFAKLKSSYESL